MTTWADDAQLAELAALDDLAYARVRRQCAADLAIGVGALDRAVKERRRASVNEKAGGNGSAGRRKTIADRLVELASETAELVHAPDGTPYATVSVGEHRETHAIAGRGFRRWLTRAYWESAHSAPPADAIRHALAVLQAQALYDGSEANVYLRVAPDPDGAVWLDLCDSEWRAARIDATGWVIVEKPPIRFRRAAGMLALPEPTHGGDLDELVEMLPGADHDETRALLLGWLVAALRPRGPYPILLLTAEQGSGKSTGCRMLRRLVDPAQAELRGPPRELRDLAIASGNGWVIGYDNLSHIPDWLSDALCRIATGGGFATRELYENLEEVIIDATRPILVNGIDCAASRGDLLDRSLLVTLPRIDRYIPESNLWARYEAARPRLLGAVLSAVSVALRREREVTVPPSLRLADAARWVEAAEPVLPIAPGAWIAAYTGVRAEGHHLALEGALAGPALLAIGSGGWKGTAAELLAALGKADPEAAHRREWPATPRAVSAAVRRLAPALRGAGIGVEFRRAAGGGRTRLIVLSPAPQAGTSDRPDRPDRPDPPRDPGADEGNGWDGRDDGDAKSPASEATVEEGVL